MVSMSKSGKVLALPEAIGKVAVATLQSLNVSLDLRSMELCAAEATQGCPLAIKCTYHRWFGRPQNELAHLIGSHQLEMLNCTGFSDFIWGLWGPITFQLTRAAICAGLEPVVSASCAIPEHWVMKDICCSSALPWQVSGCNSLHLCCLVLAS